MIAFLIIAFLLFSSMVLLGLAGLAVEAICLHYEARIAYLGND
jgi:hypothetical protein